MQTGLETGLSYVWEPALNRMVLTEAGSYRVTLTVTENGLSSSDELSIIVRPNLLLYLLELIRYIIDSVVDLNLDGSGSFSYNTGTPNYK